MTPLPAEVPDAPLALAAAGAAAEVGPVGLAIPPRLLRSVCLQLAVIATAAILLELPWRKPAPTVAPPPKPAKAEKRIRVIQLPKPAPKVAKVEPPKPKVDPPKPKAEPPKVAKVEPPKPKIDPPKPKIDPPKVAKVEPPPPAPQPPPPAPQPRPPKPVKVAKAAPSLAPPRSPPISERPQPAPQRQLIAADATAVQGVRLRVLVPRDPYSLSQHLRGSGGCLVVSRLAGGSAEVLSVLSLDGGRRARQASGPPCDGVPRLLRDAALNDALGDPLGEVRATLPPAERSDQLVLQVLLTPTLHESAREALLARFGAISEAEMGRRAAAEGYELTCFAEPAGQLRCQ